MHRRLEGVKTAASQRQSLFKGVLASLLAAATLAAPVAQAGYSNGGFETGDFTDWNVSYYSNTNGGISTFPPTDKSHLNLTTTTGAANGNNTIIVGAGTDAGSGGALAYPKWGNNAALVNQTGGSYRTSGIDQTATMTAGDIDASDGNVHIRFAIAPVLVNPSHPNHQQPYFYVEVTNITKGTKLFYTFNFANQPGVPWYTVGSTQYTDWQAFDIAPGAGLLDVGDQVRLEIIAAGCAQGASGHYGHVYVDGIGSLFASLHVSVSGPTTAMQGDQVTYTYTYANNSGVPATGVVVNAVNPMDNTSPTPLNATFVSLNAPGLTCTDPGVGNAGTVSCDIGALADGATGSFQITYTVPPGASVTAPNNNLNNGNYHIAADSVSPFLGPLFQTTLFDPAASYTLTLNKGGAGVGSVISSPVGISCAEGCSSDSMLVASGGSVTLTAVTSGTNVFTGWSGACTGTDPTCVVNVSNADVSVTANFAPDAVPAIPVPVLSPLGLLGLIAAFLAAMGWVSRRKR
jgi:uncharacterized repeat protein (TIGR02543 family)